MKRQPTRNTRLTILLRWESGKCHILDKSPLCTAADAARAIVRIEELIGSAIAATPATGEQRNCRIIVRAVTRGAQEPRDICHPVSSKELVAARRSLFSEIFSLMDDLGRQDERQVISPFVS